MRKLLFVFFSLCATLTANASDELSTRVPCDLPILVNGQRLDPCDGVHNISLSRQTGLMVDGVLCIPVTQSPRYVPAVRSDGMYYLVDAGNRAADAAFDSTGNRQAAKEAMLAFWDREFGDSLIVTQRGEWDFEIAFRDHPQLQIIMSLACFDGYHPECQSPDNFDAIEGLYEELCDYLAKGFLVLCGHGGIHPILRADARQALEEIRALQSNPPPGSTIGDRLVYGRVELVGGKYVLGTSEVADLVGYSNRQKPGQ
jgi:hypothetical protein